MITLPINGQSHQVDAASKNWRCNARRIFTAICISVLVAACGSSGGAADTSKWVTAWATSPEPANLQLPGFPTARPFNNETLRQTAVVTGTGAKLRIRLSNRFGMSAVKLGGIRIAKAGAAGSIIAGTDKALLFAGSQTVTIAPASEAVSDPIPFAVVAGDRLSVSIYIPGPVPTPDWHAVAVQSVYIVSGDQSSAATLINPEVTTSSYLLSGIDVEGASSQRALVAIGDSITDGYMATPDAQKRYPDALFERLKAANKNMSVVNAGISANRLLNDIAASSLSNRFDADALAAAGATHIIVLIGINDIAYAGLLGRPQDQVTSQQLIDGLTLIANRAHAKGLKAFVATITAFEGTAIPGYFTAEGEVKRQAVNAWIQTNKVFDGVVDFDAAIRDPAAPTRLRAEFDSGDHLHPNDAGYAAMAASVDLTRF